MQEKLRRHKVVIANAAAVENAVAREDVRIIELADTCTAKQFTKKQEGLLRNWVAEGGILWVNSDVLSLFGIRSRRLDDYQYDCQPGGGNIPILEGVRNIRLRNLDGTAHTLEHSGLIPLLASIREGFRFEDKKVKVGTTLWSLVPYGKGWISDVKEVDLDHGEGALFWTRFCQFCPGELPIERLPAVDGGEGKHQPLGLLTGRWESLGGDLFWLEDNGERVTIKLIKSTTGLESVIETLKRKPKRKPQVEAKLLDEGQMPPAAPDDEFQGVFDVRLKESGRQARARVAARLDGEDTLRLESPDWPRLVRGRPGHGRAEDTWTRVGGGVRGLRAGGVSGAPDAAPRDAP